MRTKGSCPLDVLQLCEDGEFMLARNAARFLLSHGCITKDEHSMLLDEIQFRQHMANLPLLEPGWDRN